MQAFWTLSCLWMLGAGQLAAAPAPPRSEGVSSHELYTISAVGPDVALDVLGNAGAAVAVKPTHGGPSQQWFIRPAADGTFSVVNASTYSCLETAAGAAGNGAHAGLWGCWDGPNQHWVFEATGDGQGMLVNAQTKACLDRVETGDGSDSGLQTSECWGDDQQSWSFVPVAPIGQPLRVPLATSGRWIVDATGAAVTLASVNWYGASDEHHIVGGLGANGRDALARLVAEMGFNSVRLPFSNFMVERQPTITTAQHVARNPDLLGQSAWQVFVETVAALDRQHVGIILNNHTTQPRWCCDANPCDSKWFNTGAPHCSLSLSEEQWIRDWEFVVRALLPYPMVVGVDLRNEIRDPHVSWRSWQEAAQRAAQRLHAINPHLLIMVEGINYGQDLTGAYKHPVHLNVADRLVYSPHVYAWYGFGARHPYGTLSYADFSHAMGQNWGYLVTQGRAFTAPVWVGEMGVEAAAQGAAANYWQNMLRYLGGAEFSFAYWALNREHPDGSPESFSLLDDAWHGVGNSHTLRGMMTLPHVLRAAP